MRERRGDSSAVSLRDIERCVKLQKWFNKTMKARESRPNEIKIGNIPMRATVLALSLNYFFRLRFETDTEINNFSVDEDRTNYVNTVCTDLQIKPQDFNRIVDQEAEWFLDKVRLPDFTSKNIAIKENLFVTLVCIFNKIPVFVSNLLSNTNK